MVRVHAGQPLAGWTPDGQQAAVISDGALYLVKPDGVPGEPLSGGAADKSVTPTALSWLPDGSSFVLCREQKIASWDEVTGLIPTAESSRIELLAGAMPALLEGAVKLDGKPADAESFARRQKRPLIGLRMDGRWSLRLRWAEMATRSEKFKSQP
ncbi:MAG: hypothetical protein NTV93_10900 [Verrucomicrobia bacterium]|nr:hypothetical protein [Verrucomicrobiota bacterium]